MNGEIEMKKIYPDIEIQTAIVQRDATFRRYLLIKMMTYIRLQHNDVWYITPVLRQEYFDYIDEAKSRKDMASAFSLFTQDVYRALLFMKVDLDMTHTGVDELIFKLDNDPRSEEDRLRYPQKTK